MRPGTACRAVSAARARRQRGTDPARAGPRAGSFSAQSARRAPEAGRQVIVDHPGRLHESVNDGRPDEAEAALFEVLADRIRERRAAGHLLHAATAALQRLPVDETPQVGIERAEFAPDAEKGAGVVDGGLDLQPVADDAGVAEQPPDVAGAEARYLCRVEPGKGAAVVFALLQDREPGETSLGAFQGQELEQPPVVMNRDAPLAVVVTDVQIVAQAPWTALRFGHVAYAVKAWIPVCARPRISA